MTCRVPYIVNRGDKKRHFLHAWELLSGIRGEIPLSEILKDIGCPLRSLPDGKRFSRQGSKAGKVGLRYGAHLCAHLPSVFGLNLILNRQSGRLGNVAGRSAGQPQHHGQHCLAREADRWVQPLPENPRQRRMGAAVPTIGTRPAGRLAGWGGRRGFGPGSW